MKTYKSLRVRLKEDIAIFTVCQPPLNQISEQFAEEMSDALVSAYENTAVRAIIITGTDRHFIGGTDIAAFIGIRDSAAYLPKVMGWHRFVNTIEEGPKPVIAAISGNCSRGGLEVAMACHYRLAVREVRLGALEVRFGLIPGMGGTQRLPRLVGIRNALKMITTAQAVPAETAREMGLIDEITEPDQLLEKAVSVARLFITGRLSFKMRLTSRRFDNLPGAKEKGAIIAQVREKLDRTARGYIAPFKALEAIERGLGLNYKNDIMLEARLFCDCLVSDVARNLITIFLNTRNAGKRPRHQHQKKQEIRKIGVLGSGVMGAGITVHLLKCGFDIRLWDISENALRKGLEEVRHIFARSIRLAQLSPEKLEQLMARRLKGTCSLGAFKDVDLLIEAVPENLEAKRKILKAIEQVCRSETVFGTTTSVLPVARIASALENPKRLIRLHFFNPPVKMQLMEISCADDTPDKILATGIRFARKIGKIPFVVNDGPGFCVPRQLSALMGEACFLVTEGVNPFSIDKTATDFGMPIGPAQLSDLTGLDGVYRVSRYLEAALGEDWQTPPLYEPLYRTGCYGRKTGTGWFDYAEETPKLNFRFLEVVRAHLTERGIRPRQISPEEVLVQLLARIINEGARLIQDGISDQVRDMDMAMVYGAGFPPYRGGIFRYADNWGIANVYETLLRLEAEKGPRFRPAKLLREMAVSGRTFYED